MHCSRYDITQYIFLIFVCNRKKFTWETFFNFTGKKFTCKYVSQDLTFSTPLIIYLYIFITIATLYHDSWILIIEGKQKQQIIEKFITRQQNRLWVSKSYITNGSKYNL